MDAPANGGMVKLNMTVNYSFLPDKIVGLYSKFNGMDGEAIVEFMVQSSNVAYIKEVTPQFTVMDIYSDKRAEVSQAITKYLDAKLSEEYGISVASALIFECFDHGCIGPDEGSGGVSGIWMGNSPGLKHRCDNRIERSSIGSFLEP